MIALLAKVTVILTLGAAVAMGLRQRPAATRHFVWLLTLVSALLMLPLALLPKVTVTIPVPAAAPKEVVRGINIPSPDALRRPLPRAAEGRSEGPDEGVSINPVFVWSAGTAAILSWWLLGTIGLTRIARTATPLADEVVHGRRVRVRSSSAAGAPVTWGWLRPIVLLPAVSDAWPADRRRAALMHELAHIARHDALTQLLGTLACAAYWFHPLVWIAARNLRRESEHASDDRVLAGGMMPSDYAAHLLAVASARFRGSLFAHGMGTSHLETRLHAVLDDDRARGTGSRRMNAIAFALVVAALVPLAACRTELRAATRSLKPKDPVTTLERTVNASPGETLTLDLESGASVDIKGWDQPSVTMHARVGGRDGADSRVDAVRTNDGVRVTADYIGDRTTQSTSIELEIRVPKQFDVQLDSSGGGLSIANVEGTFEGQTGGGSFLLEHLKGTAKLSTGGGNVEVTDCDLRGSVTTGGGTVTLTRVRGGLNADSGSGPVVERLAAGDVRIEKAGGDIVLEKAPLGAYVSTGGGSIDVGDAAGRVEAHTGGGDIEVGPVAGSVVASTGAGKVRVILKKAGDEQSVEITTGSGDAIVTLPADLDARFEIETSYTKRATRIDSEWTLDEQPPTGWDSSEGTPRRYIRARGVAGNGRGLVRIKVVNGDITLKRR